MKVLKVHILEETKIEFTKMAASGKAKCSRKRNSESVGCVR
jgi:hypothetical protein